MTCCWNASCMWQSQQEKVARPTVELISGCIRWWLCYTRVVPRKIFTTRSLPADCLAVPGGFVRLIRPMLVARFVVDAAGRRLFACPSQPSRLTRRQKKPAATRRATPVKKSAYSATTSKARQSSLARARASVRAREAARLRSLQPLQEAMTPQFKTDAAGQVDPRRARRRRHRLQSGQRPGPLRGELAGQALDRQHHQGDDRAGLSRGQSRSEREVTIERSDVYAASTTYLRAKDQITAGELLHLMLIASDNAAARALARTSHGGMASFVERMNEKAIELGLQNTTLRGSVGPERQQPVVRVRPVAPDYVRRERRADRDDHADARPTRSRPAGG